MQETAILVFGNGFDLQCKIKSKFIDFQNSKRTANPEFFEKLEKDYAFIRDYIRKVHYPPVMTSEVLFEIIKKYESIDLSKINMWDIILFEDYINGNDSDIYWFDVESIIARYIHHNNSERDYSGLLSVINDIVIQNPGQAYNVTGISNHLLSSIIRFIFRNDKENDTLFMKSKTQYKLVCSSNQRIQMCKFLLTELNRYEHDFQLYLRGEIKENIDNYREYSMKLFERIIVGSTRSDIYYMNFNYTLPMIKELAGNGTNVHGYIGDLDKKISDSIIIGVDIANLSDREEEYMFSKTARKLVQKTILVNQKLPSKESVSKIFFYGHSLSLADYSYFQSLFDFYDLYGGNVELIFKYTVHDTKMRDQRIYDVNDEVVRLINSYGKTMSNKDWGKNLLHKLLLEQRISLIEIEPILISEGSGV